MSNLKYKIEALLFSAGRRMNLEELENLTKAPPENIRSAVKELIEDYEKRGSSIHLRDEGNAWKLTVKDEHIDTVKSIVSKTELSKTLLETLAVIAFKYPIKQADLIKIRTNKAYDHIRELEELEYVTRQKYGRTKLIKLTPKFFEYFDLSEEKLKEKTKDFEGIAKAIEEKEHEIKEIKAEQKKEAETQKTNEEKEKEPEIDLVDKEGHKEKLATFEEPQDEIEKQQAKTITKIEDKVGDLNVVDVPEEEPEEEETEGIAYTDEEMGEEVVGEVEEMVKGEEKEKSSSDIESDVDKKVEALLKPEEEKEVEEEKDEEDQPASKIEDLEDPKNEEVEHVDPAKEPQDLTQVGEEQKEKKD